MQKINFQNLPNTSTPLNATNLNLMQDNIESAIEDVESVIPAIENSLDSDSTTNGTSVHATKLLNTYSSNELKIGKWIDGRPIYRKVLTKTCDGGTTINIAHNISNLNEVTNLRYFTFQNAGKYTDIPLNANNPFSIARITSTKITGTIAQAYDSAWELKIIIEYTKYTDPVG